MIKYPTNLQLLGIQLNLRSRQLNSGSFWPYEGLNALGESQRLDLVMNSESQLQEVYFCQSHQFIPSYLSHQPLGAYKSLLKGRLLHSFPISIPTYIFLLPYMPRPKFNQPLAPSPQQDLQQISMYQDETPFEDFRNSFTTRTNQNFIQGWIRPIKTTSQGLKSFRSNILEIKGSNQKHMVMSQSSNFHRQSQSFSHGSRNTQRPLSSKYHIRKTQSNRYESQLRQRQPLRLSDPDSPRTPEIKYQKYEYIQNASRKQERPLRQRKTSVQAVSFPLFNLMQNPQRLLIKTTSVGRVRRLLKAKQQRKM